MRSLVVEDDDASRLVLEHLLREFGPTDTAANGTLGREALKVAVDSRTPYDLVCLDIMMPGMDGQELLAWYRGYEDLMGVAQHRLAKIIMTTALDDAQNVQDAMKENCDAYIVKPVTSDGLRSELESLGLV